MNGVLIIPTGIGAAIGGHAGDANPVCKLLASCCDTLITHPNVVNASDINEMPENVLYVEGSQLDRFLKGDVNLEPVRTYNKILVVCNAPVTGETLNAVNAARHTIGADIKVFGLVDPLVMEATIDEKGRATGNITGIDNLCSIIKYLDFDALAIHTPITVNRDVALNYFKEGGLNPWGGVEAKASKLIAEKIGKPVAHAPLESVSPDDQDLYFIFKQEVKPRVAAEAISNCYLHCVLKGLHKAPRVLTEAYRGLSCQDIDFMVSPIDCWGQPHDACYEANIPIIEVRENKTLCPVNVGAPGNVIFVENYWEAAGYVMAMRAGINPGSARIS